MYTYSLFEGIKTRWAHRVCLTTILWFAGLSFGICFAAFSPYDTSQILSVLASEGSSVFLVLLVAAFPVAVCAVSLWCSAFSLCYPLFFMEALCRGFCGILVFQAMGSGAWLIRALLLFSSGVASVIMWWLFLRHADKPTAGFSKDVCISSAVTGVAAIVDIIWVSPFLSVFTKYF